MAHSRKKDKGYSQCFQMLRGHGFLLGKTKGSPTSTFSGPAVVPILTIARMGKLMMKKIILHPNCNKGFW